MNTYQESLVNCMLNDVSKLKGTYPKVSSMQEALDEVESIVSDLKRFSDLIVRAEESTE